MSEKIQIVCYNNQGWILEAIARQWLAMINNDYPDAVANIVFGEPRPGYDVYIHFIYLTANPVPAARNIVYVTHVNRWWKAIKLISLKNAGVDFVAISSETRDLVNKYVGRYDTACIIPKSIHFEINDMDVAGLTFGLFFKIYKDGRKSTPAIIQLFEFADKYPKYCKLILYGTGFAELLENFPDISVTVVDGNFDKEKYENYIKKCDYLLYLGHDEGAISIVDATTLKIPVLVTAQGFHNDIQLAKGSQVYETAEQIISVVKSLCTAIQGVAYSTNPILLIKQKIANTSLPTPVPAWRYLFVPLVKNKFLLRKGNLSTTIFYIYRLAARNISTRSKLLQGAVLASLTRIAAHRGRNRLPFAEFEVDAVTEEQCSADVYCQNGLTLSKLNRHKFAILEYDRAIALRPDYAKAHFNLAESLRKLGKHAEAIESYDRAIAIQPNYSQAHYGRNLALRMVRIISANPGVDA